MSLTVAQLVARVTADTSGFYKSMAIMNSSLIRTGGLASRALAGIGLATTGVGIISLRAAGNYQQAMNMVQAVTNATAPEMKRLSDNAIALGRDMKLPNVSAKDAADAMMELGKAGMSVNQVIKASRGTLQLGLAANIGFADSAKIVSKALKAFQMDGAQANKIANLLAAGANASTAEMEDLAYGMQNASAQMSGAGYSIDSMVVALSALVDRGLSGEQAGTALKVMFQRLQNPTKKAGELMKGMGIEIANSRGEMLPMPSIIANFAKGFETLNPLQKQQALNTIFGARANAAMQKLLQVGVKGWGEYEKKIVGTNAAQKITEARTKGFNGALQALGSALETQAILIGTAMLPAFEKLARSLAVWVNNLDTTKIIAFFKSIKDGVVAVFDFVNGSDALKLALASLAAGFAAMFIVKNVATSFMALRAAVMALNSSLYANPIILIIGALVALGAAFYLAYTRSEEFRAIVDRAFAFLRDVVLPLLVQFAQVVAETFRKIVAVVGPILSILTEDIRNKFNQALTFIRNNQEQIVAVIKAYWNIMKAFIGTAVENILSIIRIFAAVLRGDWGKAWDELKAIGSRSLSALVTIVRNGATLIINAAILLGKGLWQGFKDGASDLVSKVLQLLYGVGRAIVGLNSMVYGWALGLGKAIVMGVVDGLGNLISAVGQKIASGVHSAIQWARDHTGSTTESVAADIIGKAIPKGITEGMLLGFQPLPAKLSEKVKELIDSAQKTLEAEKGKLTKAFDQLSTDILSAFDAITANTKTKSEGILAKLISQRDAAQFNKNVSDAKAALQSAKNDLAWWQAAPQLFGADVDSQLAALAEIQGKMATAQETLDGLMFEKKKAALELKAAEERKQWEASRTLQRRTLETMLTDLVTNLAEHPGKWRFYQNKVLEVIQSYGRGFRGAGQALGDAFAGGLRQSLEDIERAAQAMAATVARYLPHSPAETGPLSQLPDFTDYMLRGFDPSAIGKAMDASLTRPLAGLGTTTSASAMGSSVGAVGGVTNNYYVEGSLIREQDLDDRILAGISRQTVRGRTLGVA